MKLLRMVAVIIALSGLLSGCVLCRLCERPAASNVKVTEGSPILFSGTVISNFGKPIQDAVVQVNGAMTKTDKGGTFQLPARIAGKYIVTIRKDGFGLFSHTYQAGVEQKAWILTQATVERVNPTQAIRVHDQLSQTGCYGALSSRVTSEDYERKIPVYGDITPSAKIVLEIISRKTECSPGVVIEISADSLVDDKNQPPSGPVDVSVSTVDLFAPDGMPGNYGVVLQSSEGEGDAESVRREGYMDSRGAGFITVTGGGKSYQLKSGRTATLTIQVDPTQLKLVRAQGGELGTTIPLLFYDEKQAIWVDEGTAVLNAAKDAYVAQVSHFSGYNADLVFSNIGCVKIDTSPLSGNFQWEVSALTPGGGLQYKSEEISRPITSDASSTLHAEYRLPTGQDVTFKWYEGAVIPADPHQPIQGVTPLGQTTVQALQAQSDQSIPFPVFPYADCKGSVTFYKNASQAGVPSITANLSGGSSVLVSWEYDYNGVHNDAWDPRIASNVNDGYQLEESINGGAFAPVVDPSSSFNKGLTDRARSKSPMFVRSPGTYKYRVRACYAANPAANQCTTAGVSNDVTVPAPPVATLKIKNNLVTQSILGTYPDVHVLRVRIASSPNTLMVGPDAEKLEVDGFCNVLPSKWISARANQNSLPTEGSINIAGIGGPDYYVYIELGYWKEWSNGIAEPLVDMSPLHSTHQCPSSHSVPPVPPVIQNAQSKHMFGTDVSGQYYEYTHRSFGPTSGYLHVTGHTSGELTLTITGSAEFPTISKTGTGTVSSLMGLNTLKPPGNDPVTGTIP